MLSSLGNTGRPSDSHELYQYSVDKSTWEYARKLQTFRLNSVYHTPEVFAHSCSSFEDVERSSDDIGACSGLIMHTQHDV